VVLCELGTSYGKIIGKCSVKLGMVHKRWTRELRVANWLKSRKGLALHYIMFKEIRDDLINNVQSEKVSVLIVFCFSRICNIDT